MTKKRWPDIGFQGQPPSLLKWDSITSLSQDDRPSLGSTSEIFISHSSASSTLVQCHCYSAGNCKILHQMEVANSSISLSEHEAHTASSLIKTEGLVFPPLPCPPPYPPHPQTALLSPDCRNTRIDFVSLKLFVDILSTSSPSPVSLTLWKRGG